MSMSVRNNPFSRNASPAPGGGGGVVANTGRPKSGVFSPGHRAGVSSSSSNTFAPSFIKTEEARNIDPVKGIEGENDFSGKRYVWLKDPQAAFVKGWIVEEREGQRLLVQCDDGSVRLILNTFVSGLSGL